MALFRYIVYATLLFSLLGCQSEPVKPSETKETTPSRLLSALASVSHHIYSAHDEIMGLNGKNGVFSACFSMVFQIINDQFSLQFFTHSTVNTQ